MAGHYVYAHIDPRTSEVIYVGSGCKSRAWVHGYTCGRTRASDHIQYLEKLQDEGFLPDEYVSILRKGLSKKEATKIETEIINSLKPRYNKPVGKGNLRLTPELFSRMKELRSSGVSYNKIAKTLGVSYTMVYKALTGVTKETNEFV